MFTGKSSLNLDSKGRLAIPSRYRARLQEMCSGNLKLTIKPNEPCVWIYPLTEWELVEPKLVALPEFDPKASMTKTLMLGHAEDCTLDSHGRLRVEASLIKHAGLEKEIVIFGQGNKFELWNEATWNAKQEAWLSSLKDGSGEVPESLQQLSL